MGFTQGAAEHGEILAEDKHQAAVDHAVAGDHAIARDLVVLHAEVGAAVLDKHVPFFKRAFVEQQLQPLARRQLAFAVLRVYALLPAAQAGCSAFLFELFKDFLHGVFRNFWTVKIYLVGFKQEARGGLAHAARVVPHARHSDTLPGQRRAQLLRLRLGLRKEVGPRSKRFAP
jgi:hypothetical protein